MLMYHHTYLAHASFSCYTLLMTNEIQDKVFKINKVIYYDAASHWGVLGGTPISPLGPIEFSLVNDFGSIGLSGNFQGVYEGAEVEVTGDVITNPRYGKQIQIKTLRVLQNTKDKEGIINFLSRSMIRGISIQNATKIYNKYGPDSIDVVLNKPLSLIEVFGIGKKTATKIADSVAYYKTHEKLIKFCTDLGLNYSTIIKLQEEFGEEAINIIQTDPFSILTLSNTMTFKQIDEIYLSAGGDPTGVKRLETALLYALKHMAILEGSTGCKAATLINKFYKLLNLNSSTELFIPTAHNLDTANKIEATEGALTYPYNGIIYYREFIDVEKSISEKLLSLKTLGVTNKKISEVVVEEEIHNFPYELNKQQVTAIKDCLKQNVAVLTGAAGSGKSSITKALHNIYERSGFKVALLSPTSKAARRLEECTGGVASTIHKFIGATAEGEVFNTLNLEDTVVIIDEASMLDILLLNKLLMSFSLSSRLLLIGDNNQLPSVQAGNVLGDLIASHKVHVSILTDIMRQGEGSNIIKYCGLVNKGEVFDPCEYSDFHYEEFGTGAELRDFFIEKYIEEVKKHGLDEVQVITPYKKGELGMDNLNKFLQGTYNENGMRLSLEPFRLGDRVRHTQNNYKKEVFNGETGIITSYDEDELTVDYRDKCVTYDGKDIDELTLAYCSTVHASQGSEYKTVFVILDDKSPNTFLFIRRLLYTAISRGKEKVYILAKPYLLDQCIENDNYKPRITRLKEYMQVVARSYV